MGTARQRLHAGRGPHAGDDLRVERQDSAHTARPERTAVCNLAHCTGRRRLAMEAPLQRTRTVAPDSLWYKDAIIYQLHVKSFFDSNNDGIGDFPGLISKLDYIAELGVNAIWLLP